MEYIKNPIVIGSLVGIATYFYIQWENNNKYQLMLKKDPNVQKPKINIFMPIVTAIIAFLLMFIYLKNNNTPTLNGGSHVNQIINQANDTTKSIGSQSYFLLKKNTIKLPDTDVFIDIVKF